MEFPELHSRFSLVIYFMHSIMVSVVYICQAQSPNSFSLFSSLVSMDLLSTSMSISSAVSREELVR